MGMKRQVFFSFFLILSLYICEVFAGDIQTVNFHKLKLKDCLLPEDHPLQNKLKSLFEEPDMFQSPQHLRNAGFNVFDRIRRGFMVASHPTIKNYLIKKFQDETPQKQQVNNYLRRINGARTLREFIKLNNLQHIVVPRKWLYRLPKKFSDPDTGKRTYVMIAEKIDICSGEKDPDGEVARRYNNMDFDILRELCIVVYYFKGLDSGLQNMPFTYQNKIAFIDTEHWKNERDDFLRHTMHHLTPDRQEYALGVLEELRAQDESIHLQQQDENNVMPNAG